MAIKRRIRMISMGVSCVHRIRAFHRMASPSEVSGSHLTRSDAQCSSFLTHL
jgi:hypothetical protein